MGSIHSRLSILHEHAIQRASPSPGRFSWSVLFDVNSYITVDSNHDDSLCVRHPNTGDD